MDFGAVPIVWYLFPHIIAILSHLDQHDMMTYCKGYQLHISEEVDINQQKAIPQSDL